jgi:L-malate glycosyltransferase
MTERLHVLVVPEWYPSLENPGAGTFVRDQVYAVARVHDVTVLAPPSSTPVNAEYVEGVRVLRAPTPRIGGRAGNALRLLTIHRAIARLRVDGNAANLVHAHVFSAGLHSVVVARRWKLPVVVTEHLTDFVDGTIGGWDARVACFTFRAARLVCPVSHLLAQRLRRLEPKATYEVVPNVVDVDAFVGSPRQPRTGPCRRILVVAALERYKGLTYLLQALRLLLPTRPDVTLDIVGDGRERGSLESEADGLPVTFLGARPRSEVAARMRDADVLAMPSLADSFGIVAMEALAAGLPVVTTSACGAADDVATHGGIVVPPADPRALCRALATTFDRAGAVPTSTVDDLRRRYGAEAIAERWDIIYRSLARSSAH